MMKHSDIKTKFLIEYDKANITSSYPSLTDYEIATLLDKAYAALIGEKLTGNNPRRAAFESDNKAIEDIQALIVTKEISKAGQNLRIKNESSYNIPDDFMYFIQAKVNTGYNIQSDDTNSVAIAELVTHEVAKRFMCTTDNMPWVEHPVCYIESNKIYTLCDPILHTPTQLILTYVKKFNKFTESNFDDTQFELSDAMAEELINLGIIFATETVESTRLNSKINIRPLES